MNDSNEELGVEDKIEIYKLINRPIDIATKITDKQTEKQINQSFVIDNNEIWASTNGHIVILSNKVIKDTEPLDDFSKFIGIESALDFPLKVNILSKLNNIYIFKEISLDKGSIENIRENFLDNRIFISNLSENFYGSARNLSNFLRKNMIWYFNDDEFSQRNKDLQMIIDNQRIKTEKKTTKYIEIITLLFTVIFGLPAVKELLEVVMNIIYPNAEYDSYYISKISLIITTCLLVLGILFISRSLLKKIILKPVNWIRNKYYNSRIIKFK